MFGRKPYICEYQSIQVFCMEKVTQRIQYFLLSTVGLVYNKKMLSVFMLKINWLSYKVNRF